MKIIQVLTSSFGGTIGLGDDGKLYRWVNNGGIWVPNWQERKPILYNDVQFSEGHATVAQTPSQQAPSSPVEQESTHATTSISLDDAPPIIPSVAPPAMPQVAPEAQTPSPLMNPSPQIGQEMPASYPQNDSYPQSGLAQQ